MYLWQVFVLDGKSMLNFMAENRNGRKIGAHNHRKYVLYYKQDKATNLDLAHSPRAILRRQIRRLTERGYRAMFASEVFFFSIHSKLLIERSTK